MTGTGAMTGVGDMVRVKGMTGAEKGAESTKNTIRNGGEKGVKTHPVSPLPVQSLAIDV